MSCDSSGCPTSGAFCLPKGDDLTVVVTVRENTIDGDLADISDATEIVFIIADELGGTVLVTKRLSLGQITISTNNYQFSTTITNAESALLINTLNYFEARITTASGAQRTVLTGTVRAPLTMIKDL